MRDIKAMMGMHDGLVGGSTFAGGPIEGFEQVRPLRPGATFPNGARAAVLFTYDVEGCYGNGIGDVQEEVANYFTITAAHARHRVKATYNVVGKMAEDYGGDFVAAMARSGAEVATHGYLHDMHGIADRVYHGHYGHDAIRRDLERGIDVLQRTPGVRVRGCRLPYGHLNEYCYDVFEELGLLWASNAAILDIDNYADGPWFCSNPSRVRVANRAYPIVEIPTDGATYDWSILVADQHNPDYFAAVQEFVRERGLQGFTRTPAGAAMIWKERIREALDKQIVFALLCHPINLTVKKDWAGSAVHDFLLEIVRYAGQLQDAGKIWCPTCSELAEYYVELERSTTS